MFERWREWAGRLRTQVYALHLASRDARVPWYAKAWLALVVAYAFSPIDLIPDFVPVLGYLDDLVLLPLGIALAIRLVPEPVWRECLARAEGELRSERPHRWRGVALVLFLWLLVIGFVVILLWPRPLLA